MKKVFKSKKGWMSLGAILVALTLIVGATFAWFSYVGGADLTADIDAGTLVLETNLPSDPDWIQEELEASMLNGVAQPGDYFTIYPEDGSEYFYIENTGSLDAIVRLSGASANVTWDVSLDDNNNYLGDATTVGGTMTYDDTPESEGFKNGVLVGMKLADPSAANDNGAIANTSNEYLFGGKVIQHKYDWVRGDHYLVIPVGMKVEFDLHIDLKTNSYEQIIEDFDPSVSVFDMDYTSVVTLGDRPADILIDNKYQNCKIELTDALGVKATQTDYRDAWMDIFDFFDGEWDALLAPNTASYGLLDTLSAETPLGVPQVPLFTVGTTKFYGVEDYLLPFAGDYLSSWGVAGNANIMTIY